METIKVLSYNVLADRYAVPNPKYPTTFSLRDRYAFIADEDVDDILNWDNRLNRILNKIKFNDPDIICLQEIELETINEDFIDRLPEYNAVHHIIWNKDSPKVVYKRTNVIGNLTLWKKDKVECVNSKFNSCAVFTELICNNLQFLLINVHLKAGLKSCQKERGSQIKSCIKEFKGTHTLITGDFNDQLIYNSDNTKEPYIKDILDTHKFVISPSELTCDVYNYELKEHTFYSFDHVVTYNLNVNVTPIPELSPIPSINEPSDHVPLIFEIHKI